MSRKALRVVLAILLLVMFFKTPNSVYAQENLLELLVKTDRMIYRLDESVFITLYLINNTDEPLEVVEPAVDRNSFNVEIMQPNNKKEKLLAIYGLELKKIRLYSKKRLKFVTKFTPELLGEYQINVRYNGFGQKPLVGNPVKLFVVRGIKK